MSLELKGVITTIRDEQSGEGKNGAWKKRNFLCEYKDGDYTKSVAFVAFGKTVDQLDKCSVGQEVTVKFNVESREYNGKDYTDAKAWSIQGGDTAQVSESADESDLPF